MDKQVQPSSLSNDFKRKRHRKQPEAQATLSPDQHYVCVICNDEALSYNFGVICCESCKAFYRRSLTSKRTYACANGGRCDINRDTRKFCPHCRMQKCLNAGMASDPLTIAYLDAVRTGSCARRTLQRRKERTSTSSRSHTLSGDTQSSNCGQSGLSSHSQTASPAAELPSSVVSSFSQPASAADYGLSSASPKMQSISPPSSRDKLPTNIVKIDCCSSTTTPPCEQETVFPKWRKLRQIAELEEFNDADYDDSVMVCSLFAQIMQEPFKVEDLGPVSENMMPDDPVAMSRFPEATLRRYISALKKVPEFQQKFIQTERFWMLRTNLLRQQAVVIAYFADPFDRCFYGSVANGATFRHPVEYSIEQFSRAGIDTTHLYDLMMTFYAHIRERFPCDSEWPVVAAFLCIVKLFSPEQFGKVDSSSRTNAAADLGIDVAILSEKSKVVYRKYKIMFMRYVQRVKDLRAGHAPSRSIDTEVYSFCDRLLTEACTVCTLCATTVEKLTRSFRDSSDSQDYVPLWLELNSA